MAAPYSERFAARSAGAGQTDYVVPAGHRALVMTVAGYSNSVAASSVYLVIAGLTMWAGTMPSAGSAVHISDLRLVAYAGETVGLYTSGTNDNAMVCGYLLSDPP